MKRAVKEEPPFGIYTYGGRDLAGESSKRPFESLQRRTSLDGGVAYESKMYRGCFFQSNAYTGFKKWLINNDEHPCGGGGSGIDSRGGSGCGSDCGSGGAAKELVPDEGLSNANFFGGRRNYSPDALGTALHYDERVRETGEERNRSSIINLRKTNNAIKSKVLQQSIERIYNRLFSKTAGDGGKESAPFDPDTCSNNNNNNNNNNNSEKGVCEPPTGGRDGEAGDASPIVVLELGSGQGGDLPKYGAMSERLRHPIVVYGVDVSKNSLRVATQRYETTFRRAYPRLRFEAIEGDFSLPWSDAFCRERLAPAHLVSCQFSVHYAFRNHYTVRALLDNIGRCAHNDALFVMTCIDPRALAACFRITQSLKPERSQFPLKLKPSPATPGRVSAHSETNSDIPENRRIAQNGNEENNTFVKKRTSGETINSKDIGENNAVAHDCGEREPGPLCARKEGCRVAIPECLVLESDICKIAFNTEQTASSTESGNARGLRKFINAIQLNPFSCSSKLRNEGFGGAASDATSNARSSCSGASELFSRATCTGAHNLSTVLAAGGSARKGAQKQTADYVGVGYRFTLRECVDSCTEYLVDTEHFTRLFANIGFELVHSRAFPEFQMHSGLTSEEFSVHQLYSFYMFASGHLK